MAICPKLIGHLAERWYPESQRLSYTAQSGKTIEDHFSQPTSLGYGGAIQPGMFRSRNIAWNGRSWRMAASAT